MKSKSILDKNENDIYLCEKTQGEDYVKSKREIANKPKICLYGQRLQEIINKRLDFYLLMGELDYKWQFK